MIHLVFERPSGVLKAYHFTGHLRYLWQAFGGAVAASNGPMPEGHFILLEPELFPQDTWAMATGWGRVRIRDMSDDDIALLRNAGLLKSETDGCLQIGGISLYPGHCNAYDRVIEIHGGGSALGDPACYAPFQALCCTLGCTRLHNSNIVDLVGYMQQFGSDHTFVMSAMGSPGPCQC